MAGPTPAKRKRVDEDGEQTTQPLASLNFERFAPDGDVIFIVQGETRVRVDSAIMRRASPVFRTMLGPNFREGHALANSGGAPVEIALPEDDAEVLGWVSRVLHCQDDTFLWQPNPATFLKICLLVEKYNMKKSLSLSLEHWIWQSYESNIELEGLWLLAIENFKQHGTSSYIL
ncbi:hypothetical protein ACHAPU_008572 [Fusarium lateritium]